MKNETFYYFWNSTEIRYDRNKTVGLRDEQQTVFSNLYT